MPSGDRLGVKILDDPEKIFPNTKKKYFRTQKKSISKHKKVFPNTKEVYGGALGVPEAITQ